MQSKDHYSFSLHAINPYWQARKK